MRTKEEVKAKLQHTIKMRDAEEKGSPRYALSCGAITALEWILEGDGGQEECSKIKNCVLNYLADDVIKDINPEYYADWMRNVRNKVLHMRDCDAPIEEPGSAEGE